MTEARTGNEDIEYSHIDDFAVPDEDQTTADEDQTVETRLIQELRKYIKEAIAEHNSFDIIDLTEQAKLTTSQQIAVHKCVVQHLRNIRAEINSKVREN